MRTARVILLLALPVLILAAPFWFGVEAEKRHARWVQALSEKHGLELSASTYARGWLASSASYTLAVPDLPLQMHVEHTIHHGPFVLNQLLTDPATLLRPVAARVHSEMTFSIAGAANKMKTVGLPPLIAETTIGVNRDGMTTLTMAPVNKTLSDGINADFKGLEGRVDFDISWTAVRGELTFPGLVLSGKKTTRVGRMTATADLHASSGGSLLGTVGLALEQAAVPELGVSLVGLRLSSTTREAGKLINTGAQYELRELRLRDADYGPARVALELRKLDVATLMKMQKALNAAHKPGMPPQQAAFMAMGNLLHLAGTLAKATPELEITQASVRTPEGEITGHAKFVLDGSRLDVAANPMLLVSAFRGDGELNVPAGVLHALARQQAQRELAQLKASGQLNANEIARLTPKKISLILDQAAPARADALATRIQLRRQGTDYQIKASIRRGRLLVNGQPWQMPVGSRY